jgi:hypothetical protein
MRMPVAGVIVSRWTRARSFRGAGDASHWFTAHMLAKLSVGTARNTGLAIPQLENDQGHDQWQDWPPDESATGGSDIWR